MKERKIQKWFEKLVREGKLLSAITNVEDVRAAAQVSDKDDFLPAFPVDSLLRERALESAVYILPLLEAVEAISATLNVSADRDNKLHPDLVLFNAEEQVIFVVELKASDKTERDAVTQLLAYDQALRNHIPFSSHFDQCLVIVSPDFGALLDHSIASLLVWNNRRCLCLKIDVTGAQWRLRVHIPRAWSAIGQTGLPEGALQTVSLALYVDDDTQNEKLEKILPTAVELIARDAERSGAHGLVLLWRNDMQITPCPWVITVGAINPFAFLEHAIREKFITKDENAVVRWFIQHMDELHGDPASLMAVVKRAKKFLSSYCRPDFEGFMSWADAWLGVRNQGVVIDMDFWGVLGDFARQMILHPFLSRERRGEVGPAKDWRAPSIGIPLVNELCGLSLFRNGIFGIRDTFAFGLALANAITACHSIEETEGPLKNLESLLQWSILELRPALRAVSIRYRSSENVSRPPPLVLGGPQHATEMKASLGQYAQWFSAEFLKDNEFYQLLFALALQSHPIFDEYLGTAVADADRDAIVAEVASSAVKLVSMVLLDDGWDEALIQKVRETVASIYDIADKTKSVEELISRIRTIDAAKHVETFNELLGALEEVVPAVHHNIAMPRHTDIDWGWIRSQIEEARQRGETFPAVRIEPDGTVNIVTLPNTAQPLGPVNPAEEVLLSINMSYASAVRIVRWDDLISGEAFR